ncbi:MAG: TcpQ domain-containing protein [Alphaproteobacteria bacterium]|nr:TcpQ domain-containing protein [Alphaproteobacteria bacterium]
MKNTVNTKKILKATIAFSGILLFGCAPVSENGVDYYEETQVVDYEPVDNGTVVNNGASVHDDVLYDDEETIYLMDNPADTEEFTEETIITTKEERSVAASTPAQPRVVPVKPEENCPTCKKVPVATPTAKEVEVTVNGDAANGVAGEVKVTSNDPDLPVVEKTIEKGDDLVIIEDGNEVIILDKTVDGNVVTDVQEGSYGEYAEIDGTVDNDFESMEAERDRLQGELENLNAEKKSLEEERTKITQIQQSKASMEACDEVKDWVASEGTTLRSLLLEWGDRVGWRVVWNMDRDYTLEAGAIFRGRFVDVAAALLRSFARAVPAPKGVFYKGNKVLVVSTREDENAD